MKEFYKSDFPLYDQLTDLTEQLPPMSETIDQIVEASIFRFFKPRRVLELGAATGNWCVVMNAMTRGYIDQHYTLVEDFSWCDPGDLDFKFSNTHNFPKNKAELEKHVSNHIESFDVLDKSIDELIETELEEKVDLIRIDCDIKNMMQWDRVIEWIDRNGSDRLIILSDDIKSTVAPYRMLIVQQLVAQGKMKLMWIGEDTAAWCRSDMLFETHRWVTYFYSLKECAMMDINENRIRLHSYIQDFLHTRRNNIYHIVTFPEEQ